MQTRLISLGDVTLNATDTGEGPPILLLHGFPDSLHMWDGVVPHLVAAGHRVVRYDLRGFGESSAPVGRRNYSIDAAVADAAGVIGELGLAGRLTVVGHDWGALHSWCLCLARPELVARHVAMTVGHPVAFRHGGVKQKLRSWYVLAFQFPGLTEWGFGLRDYAAFRRLGAGHPDIDTVLRDVSRPGRLTAGLNWYRQNLLQLFTRRFGSCRVPTLGVYSAGDPYLVERQMKNSSRYVDGEWEYRRFEGAGHWFPMEQPQEAAELILGWAARA
jgi:pimeloyl-ACP methyl ester carboxylesterase